MRRVEYHEVHPGCAVSAVLSHPEVVECCVGVDVAHHRRLVGSVGGLADASYSQLAAVPAEHRQLRISQRIIDVDAQLRAEHLSRTLVKLREGGRAA